MKAFKSAPTMTARVPDLRDAAVAFPALVGLVSLALAAACTRAMRGTGNRRIGFVALGFLVLAAKSLLKAWHLLQGPESIAWEVGLSALDLLSLGLIAWPLLESWGRRF